MLRSPGPKSQVTKSSSTQPNSDGKASPSSSGSCVGLELEVAEDRPEMRLDHRIEVAGATRRAAPIG